MTNASADGNLTALAERCRRMLHDGVADGRAATAEEERELLYACAWLRSALGWRAAELDQDRAKLVLTAILIDTGHRRLVEYCGRAVHHQTGRLSGEVVAGLDFDPRDEKDLMTWLRPAAAVAFFLVLVARCPGDALSQPYPVTRTMVARTLCQKIVSRLLPRAFWRATLGGRRTELTAGEVAAPGTVPLPGPFNAAELTEFLVQSLAAVASEFVALAQPKCRSRRRGAVIKCIALVLHRVRRADGPVEELTERLIIQLGMTPTVLSAIF